MQDAVHQPLRRLDHLTFKGNLEETRHGWLRLTPAYSVHLVAGLLEQEWKDGAVVLDPFCGTGTTALVCAQRGIACDTTDINPFLLWLARTKAASYSANHLVALNARGAEVGKVIARTNGHAPWTPPLHQIEKWWSPSVLAALGRAMASIRELTESGTTSPVIDLLKVAFCRTMIHHAHVSFGHQSMSFKKADAASGFLPFKTGEEADVASSWLSSITAIAAAAKSEIRMAPTPIHCDARDLRTELQRERYRCVITSPPYPNRMSYIRELRPYMYWLGYLSDRREAGELDWKAIGGTWGSATSNVSKWKPETPVDIPYKDFESITSAIGATSPVLGRYVAKYFHDMVGHCESLFDVVAAGGTVHYIVGNSKFYDVVLPVERIYAALFDSVGFTDCKVKTIRKRTSKKELFEFVVSARKREKSEHRPRPGG